MLIFGYDRDVARWVGRLIGVADFGPSTAIGVVRHDRMVAGAVFHQHRMPDIQLSFASLSPRWATRQTIARILNYPFGQLGVKRITCITPEDREEAIAFMLRLGFKIEGRHPDALPEGAAISLGMLRCDATQWIGPPPAA